MLCVASCISRQSNSESLQWFFLFMGMASAWKYPLSFTICDELICNESLAFYIFGNVRKFVKLSAKEGRICGKMSTSLLSASRAFCYNFVWFRGLVSFIPMNGKMWKRPRSVTWEIHTSGGIEVFERKKKREIWSKQRKHKVFSLFEGFPI